MTHRRQTEHLREGHILFLEHEPGEEAGNAHYGNFIWVLDSELPKIPQWVIDEAQDFFDINKSLANELCNPDNIVDSAGCWDNEQFVSDIWEIGEPIGFKTPDGAVILDWRSAGLKGPYTENEYYDIYEN